MRYPAILDRTDLPAVFRSVRCPRPNYALTGKPKAPQRDFLKRLAELAGINVANQICDEFGGRPVYIRSDVDAGGRVRCIDCSRVVLSTDEFERGRRGRCSAIDRSVSLSYLRTCKRFEM